MNHLESLLNESDLKKIGKKMLSQRREKPRIKECEHPHAYAYDGLGAEYASSGMMICKDCNRIYLGSYMDQI